MKRREFLQLGALSTAGLCLPRWSLAQVNAVQPYHYRLTAELAEAELVTGIKTPVMAFNGQTPAPIIRAKQGQPIRIEFENKLNEPTTIHWHGLRIPIEMDGVPFLSQPPVMPGETFVYEFTPPDGGTFWYHPHMNSVEQLGRGLVGALVVEEAVKPSFDIDETLILKHWHINDQGEWQVLSQPRYAARMGTPGEWGTVNGLKQPQYRYPAGSLVRLRVVNVDNTMTYHLRLKGVEAQVIAIDGNPISEPYPLMQHKMGPGMRLDVAFIMPNTAKPFVLEHMRGKFGFPMASFARNEQVVAHQKRTLPKLPLNPIPVPDLTNAETVNFIFEWEGAISPSDQSGQAHPTFWLINRRPWQGMGPGNIPEPVANLKLGKSYIFDLRNNTQYHHPIHLHGHTFWVLEMDGEPVKPFHTDTILLGKNGRAKAAFVADNPGRWMYHCHVIEHMKTGLMGYIQVS
ncbi:Multicopper oxidase with three cupredoxin domains (includes cell division protein FtsP and spore coat protein CotA) [Oceanospirillum multiglobuliferum]|uniref:Copper oxidase n=1 Tax=Oceanospirillum multiglobuliferum TaxID=64969 RepID=A0A1T4QWA2_9GAMM|nr:multicopper oxidase family protein [Oceanospirillum multiglobuliferum]OPX57148.1 copper oxidase [Oceanospirillum multiglobuliferum]SKA07994.1 Multicopper oxidase with three cupredoxin domains (includes cell division protein FtsP and spore coat protein CotA) [Oceanospirillum multiglobuliferum]